MELMTQLGCFLFLFFSSVVLLGDNFNMLNRAYGLLQDDSTIAAVSPNQTHSHRFFNGGKEFYLDL